jgi:hypothetical protein
MGTSSMLRETFLLADGYHRGKSEPEKKRFRAMTAQEAASLGSGHCFIRSMERERDGARKGAIRNVWRIVKINGMPKTWKRNPERVEVPLKYGMYETWRDSAQPDGTMGQLIVECDETGTPLHGLTATRY